HVVSPVRTDTEYRRDSRQALATRRVSVNGRSRGYSFQAALSPIFDRLWPNASRRHEDRCRSVCKSKLVEQPVRDIESFIFGRPAIPDHSAAAPELWPQHQ